MTIAEAIRRFQAEADRLRAEGSYGAAHDYQRKISELRSLEDHAKLLTPARRR